MATIDDPEIIARIIRNNGWYDTEDKDMPDNPRAAYVVRYNNNFGGVSTAITFENESVERQQRYNYESEGVHDPTIMWKATDHPIIDESEEV